MLKRSCLSFFGILCTTLVLFLSGKATGQPLLPEPPEPEMPLAGTGSPGYSPEGRRDPFQRWKPSVRMTPRLNLSPLERHELGHLKLVGIVWDIKEPRALVEDATGLGYIIKVGMPIGPNEGKVKVIRPTEVVVEETYIDFYGIRKIREFSIKLHPGSREGKTQ